MQSGTPVQNSLDNVKPLLQERGELAVLLKKVEARIKELDVDLRPVLEGRGEVVANGYAFKCTMTKGRKSIDKESLAEYLNAQNMRIEDFEKEGAPYTAMTVKAVTTV